MNYEIPSFSGAPEQQLEQIRSYLFRLVERYEMPRHEVYTLLIR